LELSHDAVRQIAELAKLDLTEAEVNLYAGQLSNILRPDVAGQPLSPEEVIANAADAADGQFRVSAILGDE
jgi:aspartyl-tRNA(Asn)/glutamyl-tRNA(Gln) amidotransferase subunit C